MNTAHAKSLLSDLIYLAKADGKIDNAERDFIHRIGERMHLDKETVDSLFEAPEPSIPLFTELERITHFHKLMLVMNVDRETHPKEIKALREFGLQMGIRHGVVDQLLLKMEEYEDKIIPAQDIIAIFQTYYN
ncbi:MAG: hypothetical protein CMC74_09315 [Flavobacteriaceae bacterium]|nr:hypothetical protein [Flavobacteriaceae bacterium]|tara:strand:+ start:39366 stop:39764 length:399 start_codon:yes stop_codon:yes gene_type:complete